MNSYKKYCPNVRLAECDVEQIKGAIIEIENKYWKTNEHYIHNRIGSKWWKFYYSITRVDGMNAQEYAKKKAEKYSWYADSANARSNAHYKESNRDRGFLSLAEPIKVGHHSEKRHRKAIDRAWTKMGKSVEESEKAGRNEDRAKYWEAKKNTINLSMPESLKYWEWKVSILTEIHKEIKNTPPAKREHWYVLTYANKNLKKATKELVLAKKLRS